MLPCCGVTLVSVLDDLQKLSENISVTWTSLETAGGKESRRLVNTHGGVDNHYRMSSVVRP